MEYVGMPVSGDIGPIRLDPKVEARVVEILSEGKVDFVCKSESGNDMILKVNIDTFSLVAKASDPDAPPLLGGTLDGVVVHLVKKSNVYFDLEMKGKTLRLAAANNVERDVIVLASKAFQGYYSLRHELENQSVPAGALVYKHVADLGWQLREARKEIEVKTEKLKETHRKEIEEWDRKCATLVEEKAFFLREIHLLREEIVAVKEAGTVREEELSQKLAVLEETSTKAAEEARKKVESLENQVLGLTIERNNLETMCEERQLQLDSALQVSERSENEAQFYRRKCESLTQEAEKYTPKRRATIAMLDLPVPTVAADEGEVDLVEQNQQQEREIRRLNERLAVSEANFAHLKGLYNQELAKAKNSASFIELNFLESAEKREELVFMQRLANSLTERLHDRETVLLEQKTVNKKMLEKLAAYEELYGPLKDPPGAHAPSHG
eukprot:TRINITY_DN8185_c0_g1_i7.p1 TRINITY_DN8185_c0_g1~~TRINITY_DN8185_c0_g1_i7.p1  ORF type:complete len:440 (-),score=139.43 TRINITY_DN8185_c0_g1_i7:767-2086(-)